MTWSWARLGDIAEFASGGTPARSKSEYFGGETPWITGADIAASGSITPRTFLTQAGIAASATRVVPSGTILLVTRTSVGKVTRADRSLAFSQDITALRPDGTRVDPDYLVHFLRQVAPHLRSFARGATILGVKREDVAGLEVPLPPLPEQRRIASILDVAARIQALDAKAAQARGGVISSALQSVLRSEEPTYVELAALCTRITDGTHQSPTFTSSGVPFLFISNIIGGSVNYETAKFVSQETFEELTRVVRAEPGDILYSAVGSYGVPARVESDRPVVFQRHIAHIKPDPRKVNSFYLREVMASPVVKQQADRVARGGAQKTVTLGDLSQFKIPLASESAQAHIEELARISAAVSDLAARRRALLAELQAALSSRLFNPTPTRAEGEL